MKILFIYPNIMKDPTVQMGIAYLSSIVKRGGHKTSLFDTTFLKNEKIIEEFRKCYEKEKPDLLAISIRSHEWNLTQKMLNYIFEKKPKIPVIVGGPHPTIAPEAVFSNKNIDFIVRGEAEEFFLKLINSIDDYKVLENLPNVWLRKNKKIIKNETTSFLKSLNELPFPDWDLFDKRHFKNKNSGKSKGVFEMQRGCPFSCSYCINSFYLKCHREKLIRLKSVDRAIEEIKEFIKKHDCDEIHFTDEVFILGKERLKEFSEKYSQEIGLPFIFMLRPEMVNEEDMILCKKAGGVYVSIGIESGNENLRKKILKRNVSNEQIINAFKIVKKVGLKTTSFNIIGFPGETKENIKETILLNKKVKPEKFTCAILFPYEGTEIYEKYVTPEMKNDYNRILYYNVFNEPLLKPGRGLTKKQITRLRGMIPRYYLKSNLIINLVFIISHYNIFYRLWRIHYILTNSEKRKGFVKDIKNKGFFLTIKDFLKK